MDALGRVAAAHLAEDDQHAVAGAALVAVDQQQGEAGEQHDDGDGQDDEPTERSCGDIVGEKRARKHG